MWCAGNDLVAVAALAAAIDLEPARPVKHREKRVLRLSAQVV
jgi:hypothetical protein